MAGSGAPEDEEYGFTDRRLLHSSSLQIALICLLCHCEITM